MIATGFFAAVSIFGAFDEPVVDPDGPGVSIATLDLAHGNVDADGVPLVGGPDEGAQSGEHAEHVGSHFAARQFRDVP